MTTTPLAYLHATLDTAQAEAEAARDFDYAGCGVWEARGPYPAACGEEDGVSRPRGNLRAEIGTDDIFLEAELPWDLIPHMARHDPAAVLRRIAADREMIGEYELTVRLRDEAAARIEAAAGRPDAKDLDTWSRAQREASVMDGWVRLIAEGWGWTEKTT